MPARLRDFWEAISSSLWFVPSLLTGLAAVLALGTVALDAALPNHTGWGYAGGADGAREVLSTIAGSMITVAGVSFSVMIVALTLASQQFGPRLLRNFMRDTGNQVVLGTFIATFTYCLLVLRTISGQGNGFVPNVSVTVAIVLALASLGVLIYFIHHAAVSIQAPQVIAMVAADLDQAIRRLFPETLGRAFNTGPQIQQHVIEEFGPDDDCVLASGDGYLRSLDTDQLLKIAIEVDLVVQLKYSPGDFVVAGTMLAAVRPPLHCDERTREKIRQTFILGSERTHLQDVAFSIQQLVEIAVRALSPGVNDPFTALNCIDRLSAALRRLMETSFPSAYRYDENGRVRIIVRPVSCAQLVDAAFDPIRRYGRCSAAVAIRLLESMATIALGAQREEDRAALLRQASMVAEGGKSLPEPRDAQRVEQAFRAALEALQASREGKNRRQAS